jgi:hypothetical protein
MADIGTCRTCKFSDPMPQLCSADGPFGEGICRRNAPSAISDGIFSYDGYPRTYESDWCGQWEAGERGRWDRLVREMMTEDNTDPPTCDSTC